MMVLRDTLLDSSACGSRGCLVINAINIDRRIVLPFSCTERNGLVLQLCHNTSQPPAFLCSNKQTPTIQYFANSGFVTFYSKVFFKSDIYSTSLP